MADLGHEYRGNKEDASLLLDSGPTLFLPPKVNLNYVFGCREQRNPTENSIAANTVIAPGNMPGSSADSFDENNDYGLRASSVKCVLLVTDDTSMETEDHREGGGQPDSVGLRRRGGCSVFG